MVYTTLFSAAAAAALLLLPSALAEGMYSKSSPVLQIDRTNYDDLIAKSNHTSILEFYAPWCGHCQNLKPAYEKAAKSLTGLAKVAAVNCDEESNKPLCGEMGVKGFPTLKVVKPGKKAGRPIVEDYQGARSAKAIVDAVIDKIPNHVKRLKDDDYQTWLEEGDAPKAILFSEKGTTSGLLKALAVDFLGAINVAQIRSKEAEAVEVFHVEKYPTLVLLPGGDKAPVVYDGDMKKDSMVKFLSQAAEPNPDHAPKKSKSSKAKPDKKASASFEKSSASQASSQAKTDKASQTMESLEDDPTASPDPNVVTEDTQKPIKLTDSAPTIPSLGEGLTLQQHCLNTKSSTCVLALLSADAAASEGSTSGIASLSNIHHKHEAAKRTIFPFFQLPADNEQNTALRAKLKLGGGSFEILAINGKRGWYRRYPKSTFSRVEVEDWIDAIRMGDGAKEKVPEGVIVPRDDLPQERIEVKLDDERVITDFRGQMPEGVDFEMEEVSDEELEKILAEASAKGKEAKASSEAEKEPKETQTPNAKAEKAEAFEKTLKQNTVEHTKQLLALGTTADPKLTLIAKLFAHAFRRATPIRSSISIPFAAAAASFYQPAKNSAPLPSLANPALSTTQTLQQTRAMHSKLVIIGSGPAGHTAAIYAARAELKPVMYEGFLALGIAAGGQLTTTDEVENYPGFKMIKGATLMDEMRQQSEACGTEIVSQTVGKVDLAQRPFKYWLHPMGDDENLEEETHTADAIIIATGAKARRLDLPGEEKYWGNGVSACAVCDGSLPIFREKPLVVIGGGDSAVEESLYLAKKASKVTVLVRRDVLRASKINAKRLAANPKVEIKYSYGGVEVKGDEGPRGLMRSMVIKNNKTGEMEEIDANGLFYAVGHEPATTLFKDQLKMDEDGYLITTPGTTETGVAGVFAAGDVQDKKYRQAVTSAGSGCMAALEAEKWLAEQEADEAPNGVEAQAEVKKGKPEANGDVPEYKANPLL